MKYKVRVSYAPWNYKRDYGTGKDGKGKPFQSKKGAEKLAVRLERSKEKGERVSIIKA